jgi:hypothetical protein
LIEPVKERLCACTARESIRKELMKNKNLYIWLIGTVRGSKLLKTMPCQLNFRLINANKSVYIRNPKISVYGV